MQQKIRAKEKVKARKKEKAKESPAKEKERDPQKAKVKEKMNENRTKIAWIGYTREYAREVKNVGIDIPMKKEANEKENPSCPADQDLLAQEKLALSQSLEESHPLASQIAHHVLSGYEEAARKAKNATFIMSVHVPFG